ncbi:hypothetical protein AGMMS49992_18080 [Clostridia bacterium]|nr:hypothetical protein AGMMS49992_18080 [Clostridia bacterium]
MANHLVVDFGRMQDTSDAFITASQGMTALMNDVNAAINTLRTAKWRAKSADAFFAQYSDIWQVAFQDHIKAVDHMAEQLAKANASYSYLSSKVPTLAPN